MQKDNTFKAVGVTIGIGILLILLITACSKDGVSFLDAALCIFALAALELLCFIVHKSVNNKKPNTKKSGNNLSPGKTAL